MARLLKGRPLAKKVRGEVAGAISAAGDGARPPGLAVVLIGEDPASEVYVSYKQKGCAKVGMVSVLRRLEDSVSERAVLDLIRELNEDASIDGILCQLPVPDQISPARIASAIDPAKDVDGFHPENVGRLWRGEDGLFPCTPRGIVALLEEEEIPLDGARVVVVGRSNIVGKPLAAMLLREHCTVTIAHSHTRDLAALTRSADILVSAMGRPGVLGPDHVTPETVVVDVGVSRTADGLSGDVDFDRVVDLVKAITPVPGGVGPLTIAYLLHNTLTSWRRSRDLNG